MAGVIRELGKLPEHVWPDPSCHRGQFLGLLARWLDRRQKEPRPALISGHAGHSQCTLIPGQWPRMVAAAVRSWSGVRLALLPSRCALFPVEQRP